MLALRLSFMRLLTRLCDEGKTILFYSSDDEELIGLCDRVLVLYDGKIQTELEGATLTKENLVCVQFGCDQRRHPMKQRVSWNDLMTRYPALFALILLCTGAIH